VAAVVGAVVGGAALPGLDSKRFGPEEEEEAEEAEAETEEEVGDEDM